MILPSERWHCLMLFSRKPSQSENAGLQGFSSGILRHLFLTGGRVGNVLGPQFHDYHSSFSTLTFSIIGFEHQSQFRGQIVRYRPSERWHCLNNFSRKHSPSENVETPRFHSSFSGIFTPWGSRLSSSALSFESSVLHSLGFPIRVRVLHPGQVLWGDVGSGPNSPRSEYEVQIIHLYQASI